MEKFGKMSYICVMEKMELTWWDKISLYWRYDFRHYPKRFMYGVRNLIKWFPIIWRDRNWDNSFILNILKFKISDMSKEHGRKMPYVGMERNIEIMNTVVRLIDVVNEQTYLYEYMDYSDIHISFVPIDGGDTYELKEEILEDRLEEYFQKYPLVYRGAMNHPLYLNNPTDRVLVMCMGEIRHNKASRILFELLNRNLSKWWE